MEPPQPGTTFTVSCCIVCIIRISYLAHIALLFPVILLSYTHMNIRTSWDHFFWLFSHNTTSCSLSLSSHRCNRGAPYAGGGGRGGAGAADAGGGRGGGRGGKGGSIRTPGGGAKNSVVKVTGYDGQLTSFESYLSLIKSYGSRTIRLIHADIKPNQSLITVAPADVDVLLALNGKFFAGQGPKNKLTFVLQQGGVGPAVGTTSSSSTPSLETNNKISHQDRYWVHVPPLSLSLPLSLSFSSLHLFPSILYLPLLSLLFFLSCSFSLVLSL